MKIKRGESVPGVLGKKLDRKAMIKAMGITPSEARYFMYVASLTDDERATLLRQQVDVMEKACLRLRTAPRGRRGRRASSL